MSYPEAAHIFPFSTSKNQEFSALGSILAAFWGREKYEMWSRLYTSPGVTESARNLISLNRQLHWLFSHAKLALKPLRMEQGGVVVQFHWLKGGSLKPDIPLFKGRETRGLHDILEMAGLAHNELWGEELAYRKSGLPLETGQTFLLGAKNPEQAPDFELLKLSWDLLRVAAISGAAEPWQPEDEDDTDDLSEDVSRDWAQDVCGPWVLGEEGVEGEEDMEE
jgi:hypothetical protein